MTLAWGSSRHVEELLPTLAEYIDGLSINDEWRLIDALSGASRSRDAAGGSKRKGFDANGYSQRVTHVLIAAFGLDSIQGIALQADGLSAYPMAALQMRSFEEKLASFPGWDRVSPRGDAKWLTIFADMRAAGFQHPEFFYSELRRSERLPARVAKKVMLSAGLYPATVIDLALTRLQGDYAPTAVQDIVEQDHWVFG